MKKYIVMCIAIALITFSYFKTAENQSQKIAIILPLEHEAMNQIIQGFKEELNKYHPNIDIAIYNAQGNQSLLHSIIKQVSQQNVSLIVPIGTNTTQMVLGNEKQVQVLSLASTLTEHDRETNDIINVTSVKDELATEIILTFIQALPLKSKNIFLVHSADGKIYQELENIKKSAADYGLNFKTVLVNSTSDIQALEASIDDDIGAIFMLKDHMVVSNTSIVRRIANKYNIPLIASDEGSVKGGANIALGVREKDIGTKGGEIAAKLLSGSKPMKLPFSTIDNISIFINTNAAISDEINNFSQSTGYEIIQIQDIK
jgi:putative tryptophan/tyrosine transport system substrate-binding protein